MAFPATRMRRLRRTGLLRGMVRETELTPAHLVLPLFVELGTDSRTPIEAMPGVDRLSISHAVEEASAAQDLGVPAVLVFGIPSHKDEQASGAYDEEGVVQLATRAMKEQDVRRESLFKQSVEAQKNSADLLEKKFQEAMKRAKETPDTGKPLRDIDLG